MATVVFAITILVVAGVFFFSFFFVSFCIFFFLLKGFTYTNWQASRKDIRGVASKRGPAGLLCQIPAHWTSLEHVTSHILPIFLINIHYFEIWRLGASSLEPNN